MSDEDVDAVFQCYYDGFFVVSQGNKLSYVGGSVLSVTSKPRLLFTTMTETLNVSMFGQRIWYKLPFENFSELKLMCNGGDNFQRLCKAALWTKAADIFMEKDDMNAKTCACRRWSMTGIPCRHVLRVILKNKNFKAEDFVSDWYLTSTWVKIYSEPIEGLNGVNFWRRTGQTKIQPPEREPTQGRTKKEKRKKGKNESPKKKKKLKVNGLQGNESPNKKTKLSKEGRTMHCGRCGLPGHNSTSCKNSGVQIRRPKKKQMGVGESQSQSSQVSQTSQDMYD